MAISKIGRNTSISDSGDATAITITSGEDIDIESGDIFFSTAGKGIVLGATSNTDANTLDDYEEGTFTLTMRGSSGSAGSVAGNTATFPYVKIGELVYFNGSFSITNVGSYSGNLLFTGLPFTVDGQNHPMPLGAHQLDSDNETKNYLAICLV